ncbi:hypothetical protein EV127DRAFT_430116 [Xylaria flabelliformis]|nr:hypothetical protein EV127DRAFT_430116 [Xylaria flabelliformis]
MNISQDRSRTGSGVDPLGRWPRRLLHVPSMTSYEWSPGNKYGKHCTPEYNAITYTWGRWRLRSNERPDVRSIGVSGVPWDIPRVHPDRFTINELEELIRMATRAQPMFAHLKKDVPPSYCEFVWLDIVCIDQREHSQTSASEIGRQALIFDGARQVVVWLSTFSTYSLNLVIDGLSCATDRLTEKTQSRATLKETDTRTLLHKIRDDLNKLFSDPWFTSLWTLQEAYLRADAVLAGRDGCFADGPAYGGTSKSPANLYDLIGVCEPLLNDRFFEEQAPSDLYASIKKLIEDSGMQALAEDSALATYLAAAQRKFTRPPDAIYGIQQIFDARVGVTAPGADHNKVWSLDQLEIQLGSHLLRHHPVLSQMHVYTAPAALGSAWRVSKIHSIIPPDQRFAVYTKTRAAREHDPNDALEESKCNLLVERFKDTVWCRFDGPCCAFVDFHKVFTQLSRHDILKEQMINSNLVTIYLDVTPELDKCPEYRSTGYAIVPGGPRQNRLSLWLAKAFPIDTLRVLLLGRRGRSRSAAEPRVLVGLLLLRCRGKDSSHPSLYHRRIGFCVWSTAHLAVGGVYLPNAKLMTGVAPLWKKEVGIFG